MVLKVFDNIIPTKVGIQPPFLPWIPAFAGMTVVKRLE
jgi:hypothetical protein